MEVTRRDLLQLVGIAAVVGVTSRQAPAAALTPDRLLAFQALGNVTLLHITDTHATLLPVYYREPDTLIEVGAWKNTPPYVAGPAFLNAYGFGRKSLEAYAYTHLDFVELASRYGKMGGYPHLASLVKQIRTERAGKTLLLDGGDTLQGSATSLWSRGLDMLEATNQLGVDVFAPHWEFTYGIERVREFFGDRETPGLFKGDFVAHNVADISWGPPGDPVFHPHTIKEVGGIKVGIIGQAFPYTAISHPQRFVPNLTFGIQEDRLQKLVNELRDQVDLVVVLSHNGLYVDLKLARRVQGIDVILGGHTHDAVPKPLLIEKTIVINSGAHGKFLSRLDLDVRSGTVVDYRYKLIPLFADAIRPDAELTAAIAEARAPYAKELAREVGRSDSLLFRRGNFNGTFDDLICAALLKERDAEIALSPGFRWGTCILPGQPITIEDIHNATAITYPQVYRTLMTGERLKEMLEDIADNLFNPDPYYQQGGDMVRCGGLGYAIEVSKPIGQRISAMTHLKSGKLIEPKKEYVVAGWASVNEGTEGPPVWDLVERHIAAAKTVKVTPNTSVKISGS